MRQTTKLQAEKCKAKADLHLLILVRRHEGDRETLPATDIPFETQNINKEPMPRKLEAHKNRQGLEERLKVNSTVPRLGAEASGTTDTMEVGVTFQAASRQETENKSSQSSKHSAI